MQMQAVNQYQNGLDLGATRLHSGRMLWLFILFAVLAAYCMGFAHAWINAWGGKPLKSTHKSLL